MFRQPLAEVFGYPVDNESAEAVRHRKHRLCPYHNKVPNCTKGSVTNPLGICSVFHRDGVAITCPVRLRQDWLITEQAAQFFFPDQPNWTSLLEVRLNDKHGRSAGNIDVVLVAYDEDGQVLDFGALEVQAVYVSGRSVREGFFKPLMEDRGAYLNTDWSRSKKRPPRPDYLSSSRKRLAPQLIYKGGILKAWGKKQAVAVHSAFFNELPTLPEVPQDEADMAWLVYDLAHDAAQNRFHLTHARTVYTGFKPVQENTSPSGTQELVSIESGDEQDFVEWLQRLMERNLIY